MAAFAVGFAPDVRDDGAAAALAEGAAGSLVGAALAAADGAGGTSIAAEAADVAEGAGAAFAEGSGFLPVIESATARASMLPMIAKAIATKSGERPCFLAGMVSGKACVDCIGGARLDTMPGA